MQIVSSRPRVVLATALSLGSLASLAVSAQNAGASGAGASRPDASYAGQTLTVLDGAPTGSDASQMQTYYNDIATLFKEKTGATLQWQYYSSPAQEVTTIETSTVSGSGPDVISYGTSFVGTLWATGDFAPLTTSDWKVLGGESSFIKADLYDSGVSPSKYIGVPNETNPYVLTYNTDIFKKAGISSPPKTWTQFVKDAQLIQRKDPGVDGVGIDPQDPYDPWKSIYFLNDQLGGGKPWEWINNAGTQVKLVTPTMEQAIQFYFGLVYKYHVAPTQSLTWTGAELASAFEQGKVGMKVIGGYGDLASSMGTPVQGKVGFALLPTVPYGMTSLPSGGVPIETETTGNYWAIPKYAASKESLALEFEALTVQPTIQLAQFKLLGWMPVDNAGIAAVERGNPVAKPFIDAEAAAIPTSIAPVWSYVETGVLTAVHNIGSNLATSGKWDESYAVSQLQQAQAAAQAHASSS
jgi:multiple sugar transport system substrate-binding protein